MSSTTPLNPECVRCGGKASLVCSACPEAIDLDTIPTWYCTTECQEKDLENHKSLCGFIQSHNGLFKAASVIHEVFCEARDKLLAETAVVLGDGAWVAFKNEDFAVIIDLDYMVKLPEGMTEAEVNLDQVKLYWCSLSAGLWANSLVRNVLIRRGIASKVTPLRSQTSHSDWSSTVGDAAGTSSKIVDVTHIILKVEMDNGSENFALDFYGHALGNPKAVTPMSKYLSDHVPPSVSTGGNTYFGFWREFAMKLGQKERTAFILYIDSILTDTTVDDLRDGLRSWEAKEKTTLKDLLKLSAAEIESKKRELRKSIFKTCTEVIAANKKKRADEAAYDSDDDKPDLLEDVENKTDSD